MTALLLFEQKKSIYEASGKLKKQQRRNYYGKQAFASTKSYPQMGYGLMTFWDEENDLQTNRTTRKKSFKLYIDKELFTKSFLHLQCNEIVSARHTIPPQQVQPTAELQIRFNNCARVRMILIDI